MGLLDKKIKKPKTKKSFINSVKHAIDGIIYGIKTERHMKIHLLFTLVVIIGGFVFNISNLEWIVCLILIGGVISFELVNTAIERCVDMMMTDLHPLAKFAKDTAAGSVLVMAIISFVVGCMIFIPKIIEFIWR